MNHTQPIDLATFDFIYHHKALIKGESEGLSCNERYVCSHTCVLLIPVTCLKTSL